MNSLPIDAFIDEICKACRQNTNVILTAPPGSGKTTRVPPALIKIFKKVIVLVPRRLAAVSTAIRVAEECGYRLGEEVGYQVRFDNRTSAKTQLIFMTEGVFIKKIQDPFLWQNLELVVLDEFHERSSLIDLIIGLCLEKQILEQTPKILVMSATLETEPLQSYLPDSRLIEVPDRPYPLEVIKSKRSQRVVFDRTFLDNLSETLKVALLKSKKDILIFLPGLSEIRQTERYLSPKYKNLEFPFLHGSVKLEEQNRILQPGSQRRVVLSTNIAESSLTLPSVDCVIDSGLVKRAIGEQKVGFKRLETTRISLFSARQRAGRAARTGPGLCYQLWHETDELSMPQQIPPEIQNSDLLQECLTLYSCGITDLTSFSWFEKPRQNIQGVTAQLQKWELIDKDKQMTPFGLLVQSCPLDIERAVLFVRLSERGHQEEASRLLAFIETAAFDKIQHPLQLEQLPLTDPRTLQQLQKLKIDPTERRTGTFRNDLTHLFFRYFPHRIAKRKESRTAVSSLGRGIELLPFLEESGADYYLMLAGRDLSNSTTLCEFAAGISAREFEEHSHKHIETKIEVSFDLERGQLYRIERKQAGFFILSESSKQYLTGEDEKKHFQQYLKENFETLLLHHSQWKKFNVRVDFLLKQQERLLLNGLQKSDFYFRLNLTNSLQENISDTVSNYRDWLSTDIFSMALYCTPEPVRSLLQELPELYSLPSGKKVNIDYESEQAPKISAKIQEFFGLQKNPSLLNGQLRITLEMLAPNYRPAQVTSQLENFWKNSYMEIRKELRARYPRHAWPEDPTQLSKSEHND